MRSWFRGTGIAAAFIACGLVVAGCGGAEARRASYMERGQRYLTEGNLPKAKIEFRNALQIAPNSVEALDMIGRVDERLGDLREAAGMYRSAIDLAPGDVAARADLARLYALGGLANQALDLVRQGLLAHPDDADLLTVRGLARAALKDRGAARADAQRAVEVAPNNERALALLASLETLDGQAEEAADLLRTALMRVPASVDLRQILASLYTRLGETDRAAQQLQRVVALRPQDPIFRFQLALLYARAGRFADADRVFRNAIAASPRDDEPKVAYVEFLADFRSPARAEEALAGFVRDAPQNEGLLLGLGALQQRDGHTDEAIATYRRVVARAGDRPEGLTARNRIAALDVTRAEWKAATQEVAEVLKVSPRDTDALLLRGNIALERNDPAAAIADLRTVLRGRPRAVGVMQSLARAYLVNGEVALAEETLRSAMDVDPKNVPVRIELAQILVQTSRLDQAIALLEQTVKGAPTELQAREALTRAYLAKPDLDAAGRVAEETERIAPKDTLGPYLAALVAQAQHRGDEAERELGTALERRPDSIGALGALARLLIDHGHPQDAVTRVRQASQSEPANVAVQNLLGETYLAAHDYPSAIAQLRLTVRLAPASAQVYRNLASAQLASGDRAGAERTCEQGIAAVGLEPALATDLATLYERDGRIDDAIREYEALYRRDPHLALAANNLAMLLGTYKTDRVSLDRAIDLTAGFVDSDNAALLDTAGWVRFKHGELAQALPILEKAVERAPKSSVLRFHLGMAQLQAGERDRARSSLQSALAGDAQFPGREAARAALEHLEAQSG